MTAQLWWVRPEAYQVNEADLRLLSDEERAQQQRFIPPPKRHEYLVTRLLVRTVLGQALGVAPESLTFTANEWGRPELSVPSALRFNVSHTEGLVVCLLSWAFEVGVDTELMSRAPRILGMAPRVFAPLELSELQALPGDRHEERAVTLWTLKESYIKARGRGLSLALDGFAFRFDQERVRVEVEPRLHDDGSRWQFQVHTLGPHRVSVAMGVPVDAPPAELEFREAVHLL